MVKQVFSVDGYWKVIVYWNMDYDFFDIVADKLREIGFSGVALKRVEDVMAKGEAKAVTCSSIKYHVSIIIFNLHLSQADYVNSIVHEAEHIKQVMLQAYEVEDMGEPPAYTIGYIVMRMWEVFGNMKFS